MVSVPRDTSKRRIPLKVRRSTVLPELPLKHQAPRKGSTGSFFGVWKLNAAHEALLCVARIRASGKTKVFSMESRELPQKEKVNACEYKVWCHKLLAFKTSVSSKYFSRVTLT